MSKSSGLHNSIKVVMNQFGDKILLSPQLVNYLDDYKGFKDYPACKYIIKDIQDNGELRKLYIAYKAYGDRCRNDVEKQRAKSKKRASLNESLLDYVYDCFLYAFGILTSVDEPSSNEIIAHTKGEIDSNSELEEKYHKLQEKYNKLARKKRKPIGCFPKLLMGIVAFFLLGFVTLYFESKDDIDRFNNQLTEATEQAECGNYMQSLMTIKSAKENYNGVFFPFYYTNKADKKIDVIVGNACYKADELISQYKFTEAKAILNDLPESLLTENVKAKDDVEATKGKYYSTLEGVSGVLVEMISQNGGSLNAEGKKILEEALLVNPDNYWLNFIKEKEK